MTNYSLLVITDGQKNVIFLHEEGRDWRDELDSFGKSYNPFQRGVGLWARKPTPKEQYHWEQIYMSNFPAIIPDTIQETIQVNGHTYTLTD
jgi:hypothetical protein